MAPGRQPKNEIPRCARNDKAFQITNYPITKLQISQFPNFFDAAHVYLFIRLDAPAMFTLNNRRVTSDLAS
jgi:hypothetical protein